MTRPRKRLKFSTEVALLSIDVSDTSQRMHNILALRISANAFTIVSY